MTVLVNNSLWVGIRYRKLWACAKFHKTLRYLTIEYRFLNYFNPWLTIVPKQTKVPIDRITNFTLGACSFQFDRSVLFDLISISRIWYHYVESSLTRWLFWWLLIMMFEEVLYAMTEINLKFVFEFCKLVLEKYEKKTPKDFKCFACTKPLPPNQITSVFWYFYSLGKIQSNQRYR